MRITRYFAIIGLLLFTTFSTQPALSQSSSTSQTPEQYLRATFFGSKVPLSKGEALATAKGASLETRAWFVPQASTGKSLLTALGLLEGMKKEAPDSAWTLAARTHFTADIEKGIELCDKAVAKDSRQDILLLCADGVTSQIKTADDGSLVEKFLARHREGFGQSALGLVVQGKALSYIHRVANRKPFDDDATALFDEALKKDPSNESAIAAKLDDLGARKQFKEAEELIGKNSARLESTQARISYLSFMANYPGVSKEDIAKQVEASERKYIESGEPSIEYVAQLSRKLKGLSKQREEVLMDLIQQRYPNTDVARCAKFHQITKDLDDLDQIPTEKRKRIAVQLIDFVKQGLASHDSSAVRAALPKLTAIAMRNDLTSEQLYQIVTAVPEESAGFMTQLADRNAYLPEIEPLAAAQLERMTREAQTYSLRSLGDLPEWTRIYLKQTWFGLATWEDTLGWIYLQQGRLVDAERKLTTAEGLLNLPNSMGTGSAIDGQIDLLVHLGRLQIAKADYVKAEEYLSRAISVESPYTAEHPAIAAYKQLYIKQHGSEEGLEKYMAAATEKDRERRKAQILAERIADAKPILPFKLTRVDGKTVSSEDLKGKIAVINFWGTWCGPCKAELPEIQKFADKYKDHPNVVFLAIDTKDTLDQVKTFLAEKKYSFPVLMEGDYVSTAKVDAFPTTWFIDRDGKKVFEKAGSTKRVLEEFTWRVDALLGN